MEFNPLSAALTDPSLSFHAVGLPTLIYFLSTPSTGRLYIALSLITFYLPL